MTNSVTFSEISFRKTENALETAGFRIGATMAWEAVVLPIYESCVCEGIIAEGFGKFNPFLSKEEIPSGSGPPCPCAAKKSS